MSHTVHLAPVPRFAAIIDLVCKAVACRGGPRPIGLSGLKVESLPGPLLNLIWNMLRRVIARFTHAATTPPAPYRPRARQTARPRPAGPLVLPRNRAWLLKLIQETAGGASQLRDFLNDPEIAAMIAADPRLGRILRPLCAMLGIQRHHTPLLWQYPSYQPRPKSRLQPPAQSSPRPTDAPPPLPPPPPPPPAFHPLTRMEPQAGRPLPASPFQLRSALPDPSPTPPASEIYRLT